MANAQTYLNHLLQNTGITPSCSEEEREAADIIADIFTEHGFEPEVQEFTAKSTAKIVQAVLGIAVFVGSVLMGMNGIPGYLGVVVTVAVVVIYVLERMGKPVFSQLGAGGLSQNVIAYHKAEGPLASPRNRPVVVVSHYDSPREDLLYQEPFSKFRPVLVKLLPYCMVIPAVIGIIQLFPLPESAKTLLWVVAIVIALVPLFDAIAIIANRFILPYTTGAVCNKSSVAAMLGVMDDVAPCQGENEFPEDVPFGEYYNGEVRAHEEELAAIEAERAAKQAAKGHGETVDGEDFAEEPASAFVDLPDEEGYDGSQGYGEPFADDLDEVEEFDETLETAPVSAEPFEAVEVEKTIASGEWPSADESSVAVEETIEIGSAEVAEAGSAADVPSADETLEVPVDELAGSTSVIEAEEPAEEPAQTTYPLVNAEGNIRYGAEIVRSLGMLSDSCMLIYPEDLADDEEDEGSSEPPAFSGSRSATEDGSQRYVGATEPIDVLTGNGPETASSNEASQDEWSDWYDEEDVEGAGEADLSQIEENRSWKTRWTDWFAQKRAAHERAREEATAANEAEDGYADEPFADEDETISASDAPSLEPVDEAGPDILDQTFVDAMQPSDLESAASGGTPDGVVEDVQVVPPASEEHPVAAPPVDEQPEEKVETVDSIMAEINAAHPPSQSAHRRNISIPSTTDVPTTRTPNAANRATLLDLPDPSDQPVDPFASPYDGQAGSGSAASNAAVSSASAVGVDSVEVSGHDGRDEPSTEGRGHLFKSRKKQGEESMSEWLGVESDFDAKESGRKIGSWDNFDNDDEGTSWKGGAASTGEASEEELRESVASMGDDELLGHDIWFVATGASEDGHAGMDAFLDEHRDMLRGVFVVNLECVGAGQVAMVSTEGEKRVLKGDKRIMNIMRNVSDSFHNELGTVEMDDISTDAYAAMNRSLRALTLGGVDETGFACSHSGDDQVYNIDPNNISFVSDVVTEFIRRS